MSAKDGTPTSSHTQFYSVFRCLALAKDRGTLGMA
jgi:hypothetical protein